MFDIVDCLATVWTVWIIITELYGIDSAFRIDEVD